jgi:predicted PurR-regulated permease PerM
VSHLSSYPIFFGKSFMNAEWTKPTKYIVGPGLVLFGIYVLYLIRPVVTLLVIAALIAFLLMPVVSFLHTRLKIPRSVAVLLSYLLLIVLILLSPLLFVPAMIEGFNVIVEIDYQILIDQILQGARETARNLSTVETQFFGIPVDLSGLVGPALQALQNVGSTPLTLPSAETIFRSLTSAATITFDVATSVAGTVFFTALAFIFTLVYAVYMSLDAHKFAPWFLRIVPEPHRPEIAQLLRRLRRIWRAYFRGQLYLMFIIGLMVWIGGTALGLPGAFALAIIAGLMEVMPGLGPFLAAVPAVIVALIQGSTHLDINHFIFALIVAGFYWGVQQIENNFIVPRVLGEAVELHPLVVMVGVVVGASVGGILGALLAAPVIVSAKAIVSYMYAKILDQDPFPPQAEEAPEIRSFSWEQVKSLWLRAQHIWLRQHRQPIQQESQPKAPTENNWER